MYIQARKKLNERVILVSEGIFTLDTLDDTPMVDAEVESIRTSLMDNETPDLSHITPDWLMEVMEG